MKRELSPFFCKELLPSHLEGLLDATRKEAVEEMLAKNEDLKLTFDSMKSKIKFLESLSEVEPHSVWIEKVNDPRQPWKIQVKKWAWSSWSETAQWSFQLFVVGVLVMITVRFVPWLNLARTFQNAKPTAPTLNPVVAVEDSMEVLKPRPVYGPEWPKNLPAPEQYAVQQAAAKKRNQDLADIVAKTDEEITEHTGTDAEEITEEVVQRQGYVWRGVIKVEELNDEVSQKVVAIIQKLGGKKAGQVELGWKKGDSRYFHFTIPESHYTEFNQSLQDIGQIQLKKEKHPRVMPQGSMRIIMSLESGAP